MILIFGTNATDRMRILATGNVGIGTTNPQRSLHVQTAMRIGGSGAVIDFGDDMTNQIYRNGTTNELRFTTNATDRLVINPSGNIGIGTTNPETKLDVDGNLLIRAYAGTSGTNGIFFRSGFATTNQYNCSILTFDHSSGGANDGISINGFQGVSFCTGANTRQERMRIDGGGRVGIGTTNPGYKLDIQGGAAQTLRILDTRAAGDAIIALKEFNDNNGFDMAYIGATDDRFYIRGYNNSSTPRVDLAIDRITSNVGIGMTNPMYKLDVAGTINASNILINGSLISASSTQWITSGANIYANNLLGNVGIGTTNPTAYKLTVNGTIGASGNITASYSDERLKTITEYVSDVLPILNKIRVFKYNCNDIAASYGYDKNKKEIGLSAQEIQKYYPEVVSLAPFDIVCENENINSKSGENYLTLDYVRLVPVLLQGIKDLNNVTTSQQNTITDLEERLARLEKIINN